MAKRRKSSRRSRTKFRLKKQTLYTIFAVLLWIGAGFLFLAFGQQGELQVKLFALLYSLMGWGVYLLPFNLIALGFLIIGSKTFLSRPNFSIGLVITTLSLIGL